MLTFPPTIKHIWVVLLQLGGHWIRDLGFALLLIILVPECLLTRAEVLKGREGLYRVETLDVFR
ncbi:uncharacterized protein DS421_7g216940 [Arachis hypogaea]|nr:uncharacterized protein DS421_7g216940 [Arachis hypogaea]